jgi:hypothetical protein
MAGAGCAAVKGDENKRCSLRVLEGIETVSGEHGQGKGKQEKRQKCEATSSASRNGW